MKRPEDFWAVDPEFSGLYAEKVDAGRAIAAKSKVVVLGLARNAEKNLANSLKLLGFLGTHFAWPKGFVFENDSDDNTVPLLTGQRPPWLLFRSDSNGRPHLQLFEKERTDALAEYRNVCKQWAFTNAKDADYVVVVDLDADGGFSVDGVLNSIAWLDEIDEAFGMGSYSLFRMTDADGTPKFAQYDAWAARLNHWSDRVRLGLHKWYHVWMPPVGSEPVRFYSCFGGLAVYRARDYFLGEYRGGDCEHVTFHRSIHQATGRYMYFNSGSRFATQFS